MISGYQLMWLMVMFDLPVETKENRRDYRRFVDKLEDDGFSRVQFSIYVRPCSTDENTLVHQHRVIKWLPPLGEIRVLKFTDKQWGRMLVYREQSLTSAEKAPEQFLFFDEKGDVLVDEQYGHDVVQQEQLEAVGKSSDEASALQETASQIVAGTLIRISSQLKKQGTKKRNVNNTTPSFEFYD